MEMQLQFACNSLSLFLQKYFFLILFLASCHYLRSCLGVTSLTHSAPLSTVIYEFNLHKVLQSFYIAPHKNASLILVM